MLLVSAAVRAATPALELSTSADVTVALGATLVTDEELARDDLAGAVVAVGFPGLASNAAVIAFESLPGGDVLLAFENAVVLPGNPSAITARPGDVVRLQGATYSFAFQAASAGLPAGTLTDAISTSAGDLLLSFDTSVDLGAGALAHDEDMVLWNGASLALFLDTSAFGVPAALDLDAAHWIEVNGRWWLSFDGSGLVGGVFFADEDVLELDPGTGTWQLAFDGSAAHPSWAAADLDALRPLSDVDADGLADDDEALLGTDPLDPDSDDDGLTDGVETDTGVFVGSNDTGSDPLDPDSDGDGFDDGAEVAAESDPNDPNSTPLAVPSLTPPAFTILVLMLPVAAAWSMRRARRGRRS